MTYIVQQHGEWSENGEQDLDFDAETLEEAEVIVANEIPKGTIYLIIDERTGAVIEEGEA